MDDLIPRIIIALIGFAVAYTGGTNGRYSLVKRIFFIVVGLLGMYVGIMGI